ncbi:hypothetical protein GCM10011501_34970 [Thalassotalea profundi]|uniref:Uncharacterized protein n=2 Tax=Thalassotalea profundi TaxID=2036687 RepID=A0ABQ3J8M4_9GAMM|nr:hypothetical protein GCM10011501_34970 [Thalassotalea profundi]
MKTKKSHIQVLAATVLLMMQITIGNQSLFAAQEESEDDALAKAQAQMNAEVLSKPFLAEKPEEVDAYIKSMLEKKVKPPEYQGTYWRSGYTCRDLLRYSWTQYRNCKYYYRYHGRYYY